MTTKRILVLILVLAAAAGGFFVARNFERQRCAEDVAALASARQSEVAGLKSAGEAWAEAVAKRQGEAILRAFVAGITPSILAERRESLEISAVSLLRIAGIEGIHAFKPDGKVLYSSDAKLVTLGRAGDAGAWALAAPELITRASARPGSLELALPIVGSGRVLAVIWMELGVAAIRDADRPKGWSEPVAATATESAPAPATGDV
jgi:hypothetical protein